MQILSCNSNKELAANIASRLGVELVKSNIQRFKDDEVFVEIHENVRGGDIFVVQSTSYPANDHLMELLITIDALKRASAGRITAVIPYFGYARQDRRAGPRSPITAKLVADLITTAGADKVLTMDLHAGQIQGFFNIPVDNLQAMPVFLEDISKNFDKDKLLIISPDVGGVVRARSYASKLDADLAIVDKRREKAGVSEVMNIIGDVRGKECIIVDDIVDSAGTLCNAAEALINNGAISVTAYITHGVLSQGAIERVEKSKLQNLVITDSIHKNEIKNARNIRQISVAGLMAEAIKRVSEESSVSSLFD
ncbi:MAG: ribose-phosphate pyrophosphokinase [Alphaproteobacteria bacterium]|nr:ribose-phosphate pyrophosphokinase [Alphaproteobacteria bacterium]OJV15781.1 MAG: phosphoribosylpyrophosphate synthetase [Alphaproteobacteria bacterium 33-17]